MMMNSYERGKQDRERAHTLNPYRRLTFGVDREDRMQREVNERRWEAGYCGRPDPYPEGWAG